MSALNFYVRKDQSWSDHPPCVSPIVTTLAINLNDFLTNGEREEVIGPHLFAPVGTNTGEDDERTRADLIHQSARRLLARETELLALPAPEARREVIAEALRCILECCAVGARVETVPACSRPHLHECLSGAARFNDVVAARQSLQEVSP